MPCLRLLTTQLSIAQCLRFPSSCVRNTHIKWLGGTVLELFEE